MELSQSAQQVIKTHVGYRCVENVTTDYHKPLDILDFEINELYNDDILDFLENHYNIIVKNIYSINKFIKNQLGNYDLIWVTANPLKAIEFYSNGHHKFTDVKLAKHSNGDIIPVEKYQLPDKIMILSDLGEEGQLIAYPTNENNELKVKKLN